MDASVKFKGESAAMLSSANMLGITILGASHWLKLTDGLLIKSHCRVLQQRFATDIAQGKKRLPLVRDSLEVKFTVEFRHYGVKIEEIYVPPYDLQEQGVWLNPKTILGQYAIGMGGVTFRLSGSTEVSGMVLTEKGAAIWPEARQRHLLDSSDIYRVQKETSDLFQEGAFLLPEALLIEYDD